MTAVRYTHPAEGEWITPRRKDYRLRCCDCALIHSIDFRIVNRRIQFRARRHKRATAAARRKRVATRKVL